MSPAPQDQDLRERFAPYEEQLASLPFVRRVRIRDSELEGDRRADLTVQLELSDGSLRALGVVIKSSHLPRDAAHHLRADLGADPDQWLIAAPHVGAPLGNALEADGAQFIDQAGNCYLRVGDRFVARIQGRTLEKLPATSKSLRSAGYQVLFALLARPDLVRATQREVAEAAGTSRQPVIDLLARLVEERVLTRAGRRHEWVASPDGALLDRWVAGYRSHLRPKLDQGRYRVPAETPDDVEAHLSAHLDDVRYGGTAGAHRLVGHYRGPFTVAYLAKATPQRRRALQAIPSRSERVGDLLWMSAFGTASSWGETEDTVHPLLIYAELLTDPDPRAGESARELRERFLAWSI